MSKPDRSTRLIEYAIQVRGTATTARGSIHLMHEHTDIAEEHTKTYQLWAFPFLNFCSN